MEGTESATFLHAQSVHAERLHAWLKSHGWLNPFVEPVRSSVGEVGFPLTVNVDPANVVVLVQQLSLIHI